MCEKYGCKYFFAQSKQCSFLMCAYSQVQKNLGGFFRKCEITLFADIFRTWPRVDEEPAAPDRSQGDDAAAREKCDVSSV